MECEAAREAMLECDPDALEGRGDSALAAHLRACPDCRRRAATLVAELRALDDALAALAGPMAEAGRSREGAEMERPASARAPAERGGGARGPEDGARVPRGLAAGVSGDARWQRLWRLTAPVAVAAALAVLVLAWPRGGGTGSGGGRPGRAARGPVADTGGRTAPAAGLPGPAAARGRAGPELRVRVPADARVAVFQTRDPSVAVVWFFPTPKGG